LNADSSAPTAAATIATFAADGGDVIGESPRLTGYHAPGAMHRAASLSRKNDYLTTTGADAG
jgi:hypothetical protein